MSSKRKEVSKVDDYNDDDSDSNHDPKVSKTVADVVDIVDQLGAKQAKRVVNLILKNEKLKGSILQNKNVLRTVLALPLRSDRHTSSQNPTVARLIRNELNTKIRNGRTSTEGSDRTERDLLMIDRCRDESNIFYNFPFWTENPKTIEELAKAEKLTNDMIDRTSKEVPVVDNKQSWTDTSPGSVEAGCGGHASRDFVEVLVSRLVGEELPEYTRVRPSIVKQLRKAGNGEECVEKQVPKPIREETEREKAKKAKKADKLEEAVRKVKKSFKYWSDSDEEVIISPKGRHEGTITDKNNNQSKQISKVSKPSSISGKDSPTAPILLTNPSNIVSNSAPFNPPIEFEPLLPTNDFDTLLDNDEYFTGIPSPSSPITSQYDTHNISSIQPSNKPSSTSTKAPPTHIPSASLAATKVPSTVYVDSSTIDLLEADIETLQPGQWLNDTIIDFEMDRIRCSIPVAERDKFLFVSVLCYSTQIATYNGKSKTKANQVRQPWGKPNISKVEHIIMPIHINGNHYALLVIRYPYLFSKNKNHRHEMVLMNSMANEEDFQNITWVNLRAYVNSLLSVTEERDVRFCSVKTMPHVQATVTQQTNAYDCGIFTLHYARCYVLNTRHFNTRNTDWLDGTPMVTRANLLDVLNKLHQEQKKG